MKIIKLLQYIGKYLHKLWVDKDFFDITQKHKI